VPAHLARPEKRTQLRQTVEEAVARSILLHPFMQIGVLGEPTRKPTYIELATLDMAHHVHWRVIGDAEDNAEALLATLTPELDLFWEQVDTRPPWRLLVLHTEAATHLDIVLIWNHTLFDGMSSVIFHTDLQRHLTEPADCNASPLPLKDGVLQVGNVRDRLPPPQEKILKYTLTPVFAAKVLYDELCPPTLKSKSSDMTARWAPIPADLSIKSAQRLFRVDAAGMDNLVRSCRAHKTSVTGLLHALTATAFAGALSKEQAPRLRGSSAINMRQVVPPRSAQYAWVEPDRTMANYVSQVQHDFMDKSVAEMRAALAAHAQDVQDGRHRMSADVEALVWENAATVRQQLARRIKLGSKNESTALMGVISDWPAYFRDRLTKPREASWLFSNLGAMEAGGAEGGEGGWRRERAFMALSNMPSEAALEFSVASVKGGELCVTVNWHETGIEADLANGIVDKLRDWVKQLPVTE
jgi:hypothetical protein